MPKIALPGGKSISFGKSKAPGKGPEGDPTPRVEATGATNNPLADPAQALRDQWAEQARHIETTQGQEAALGQIAGGGVANEDTRALRIGSEAWRQREVAAGRQTEPQTGAVSDAASEAEGGPSARASEAPTPPFRQVHEVISDQTDIGPAGSAGEGGAAEETGESVRSDSTIPRLDETEWDRLIRSLEQGPNPADQGVVAPDTGAGVPPLGPPEAPPGGGLTQEANDLLRSVEAGGVPAYLTPSLERIARENGIEATPDMTPNQIVDRLRMGSGRPDQEAAATAGGGGTDDLSAPYEDLVRSAGQTGAAEDGQPPRQPPRPPAGGPVPEGPQPGGLEDPAQDAMRQAREQVESEAAMMVEDARAAREQLHSITPQELEGQIADRATEATAYQSMLQTGRLNPAQQQTAMEGFQRARTQQDQLQRVLRERQRLAGSTGDKTQEEVERRVSQELENVRRLPKMTVEELDVEKTSEEAALAALRGMRTNATSAERAAIDAKIRDSEARLKAIEKVSGQKAGPATEAKAKAEAKKLAEEFKEAQKEVGAVREIAALVETHQNEFARLKTEIKDLNEQLAQARDPDRRKEIEEKIREAQGRTVEVGNKLKDEKEALKKARERQREEAGVGEAPTRENIREMSVAEYLRLKPEDRAKFLEELGEAVGNPNIALRGQIEAAIRAGAPLSIEHRAMWAKDVADRLINKERGRGKVDMKLLYRAGAQYPEIAQAVLNRIAASDAVKALEERYKGNFAKMLDWAKKDWHWLWILLAIAGGTTVAVVGPVTAAKGAFTFATR